RRVTQERRWSRHGDSRSIEKTLLVMGPLTVVLLVLIEHIVGGRQLRSVRVLDATDRLQKVPKVVSLGKAGELGDVVQTYVDEMPRYKYAAMARERILFGANKCDSVAFCTATNAF